MGGLESCHSPANHEWSLSAQQSLVAVFLEGSWAQEMRGGGWVITSHLNIWGDLNAKYLHVIEFWNLQLEFLERLNFL